MIETERCPVLAVLAAYDESYSSPGATRSSVAAYVDLPLASTVLVAPAASRSDYALQLDMIRRGVRAVSRCENDRSEEPKE